MSRKTSIEKHLLVSERLRRVPAGFGWVDHRLLRMGFLRLLTPDAIALYLLLVLAADGEGLSFYGDGLASSLLGLSQKRLDRARENLVSADLVAWRKPLYQLLEIPGETEGGMRDGD